MRKSLYFRRILGVAILLAAIAIVAMVIHYFTANARNESKSSSSALSRDVSMETIHFSESHENRKKWELFARSGIHDKAAEITLLKDVRFIVERDDKNGPVTVTAQHGEYRHKLKTIHLAGNVLAKTDNGMTFETAQIDFDSVKKVFVTKEKVRLTDAALIVEGVGMDLYSDRQQVIVKSRVEATVYPARRLQ